MGLDRAGFWLLTEIGRVTEFGGWRQRWWGTIWRWSGRTAGGVGERLRWAQSSPGRGVGSPEARNTHSLTHFTASHSLAVPWFLYPPPTPPNTHCKYTSCSSSFKAPFLSISSLQRHNKLSTNSLGFQSANQTAQACRSVHLDTQHQHTDMFLLARWQICFLRSAFLSLYLSWMWLPEGLVVNGQR